MELGKELDKLGVLCIPQFIIWDISILETEIAFAIFLIESQLEKQYRITYSHLSNKRGAHAHCLDLVLNGLLTRRNFWHIPGMLGN